MSEQTQTKQRPRQAERYDPRAIERKWQARWEADGLYHAATTTRARSGTRSPCSRTPPATCTSATGTRWRRPTPPRATSACTATTSSSPWASTRSGCPPRTPPSRTHTHPAEWTFANIDRMRGQLKIDGRDVRLAPRGRSPASPDYYKWTQWWFLQLLKHDLAYRKKRGRLVVPERPDRARERAGRRWPLRALRRRRRQARPGAVVLPHHQLRRRAARLLEDGVARADQSMQRNWIGRSEGAELRFGLDVPGVGARRTSASSRRGPTPSTASRSSCSRRSTRSSSRSPRPSSATPSARTSTPPASETEIERMSTEREKTGVFTGAYVTNLFNGERVPDLDRRLRARDLRHRRRHGRARPRPARLRVREEVRPARSCPSTSHPDWDGGELTARPARTAAR